MIVPTGPTRSGVSVEAPPSSCSATIPPKSPSTSTPTAATSVVARPPKPLCVAAAVRDLDLQPDTAYHYRVASGGAKSAILAFRITVAILADVHNDEPSWVNLRSAAVSHPGGYRLQLSAGAARSGCIVSLRQACLIALA